MKKDMSIQRKSDGLMALEGPELVFGLVGAVGCDTSRVLDALASALALARYSTRVVQVSSLMHQLDKFKYLDRYRKSSEYTRIKKHMEAGTKLRVLAERGDIMAWLAIGEIRSLRDRHNPKSIKEFREKTPLQRTAYIIKSIKHPDEAKTLRDAYGRSFFLVSAYDPRENRAETLAGLIAKSNGDSNRRRCRHQADELINIDEQEEERLGQSVRDSFPLADIFVDVRSISRVRDSIDRFVGGIFGDPFITPTRDEFGMYQAFAAGLRSADLGRQVGASISTANGHVLSVGCNDVPRANGGQYWFDDFPDHRDFQEGFDSSEKFKREMAAQLVKGLIDARWTPPPGSSNPIDLAQELVHKRGPLRGTSILSLLEFGRPVHAEMAAIVAAADRGISIHSGTMFSTTFPCHLCARHIVAAGLIRVVYIEPYPKSQAEQLYKDSIVVDPIEQVDRKVVFEPFVGIAPSLYAWMFKCEERKQGDGSMVRWSIANADPKFKRFVTSYLLIEERILGDLLPRKLREIGVEIV